jgi:hypothetical protein
MNGRVYDYNLGRFMSVDPFIQGDGNSQGINPYSYVMNNPLGYTDPTGYSSETVETVEFEADSVETIEVYEDGSIKVTFNNGAASQSFSGASVSVGGNTIDIGSQIEIAKTAGSISKHVYGKGGALPSNIQQVKGKELEDIIDPSRLTDELTGLDSALYKDTDSGHYYYALAGTVGSLSNSDWVANGEMEQGLESLQHSQAVINTKIIMSRVGKDNLTTVGHSLGGGLASFAALKHGIRAFTFNSAGLHPDVLFGANINMANMVNIQAYYIPEEFLAHAQGGLSSLVSQRVGVRRALSYSGGFKKGDSFEKRIQLHGIDEVNKALYEQ